MKNTQVLAIIGLTSFLYACGGGEGNKPKYTNPSSSSSSVAVSSSSVAVSSSSVAVSSSSVAVSSSSVASSSSSSAAPNKVARIADTVGGSPGDTGELRINVPTGASPLLSGKLTVSFFKDSDLADSNGAIKDAYVTLWGAGGTSNSNAVTDVRIQSTGDTAAIIFRDQAAVTATPYQTDAWQTISISWSSPNVTTPATVNVVINGDTANTKTFTAISGSVGGVTSLAFRVSDNSNVITSNKAFYVDDWRLYSDAAGTTEVLYDDFEDFAVTTNLNGAQIRQTGSTYHGNTQDASVVEKSKDTVVAQ